MPTSTPPQPWHGVGWVITIGCAWLVLAMVDPHRVLELCAKEGPIEAAGHVVLGAAALSWLLVRTRQGRGAAWVAAAAAVVLGEELDWLGVGNLHNAMGGASYLFFAIPWLALYVAAVFGQAGPRWIPPRIDALAFGVVVGVAGVSLIVSARWEQALDELSELMLYTLLAVGGLRAPQPRSSNATKQRAPRAPSPVR